MAGLDDKSRTKSGQRVDNCDDDDGRIKGSRNKTFNAISFDHVYCFI